MVLLERDEMAELEIPGLVQEARRRGIEVLLVPVPDLHAPAVDQAERVAREAIAQVRAGKNVVIHCRGGLGRAGTLAACCCIRLGLDAQTAMAKVREVRPGAI